MITASITLQGQPEKRMEILQTIKGIRDELSKDTRCKQVNVYQDLDDENTFFFVENWSTEQDLDTYLSSRLFKVLLGLTPILKEPLKIKMLTEINNRN